MVQKEIMTTSFILIATRYVFRYLIWHNTTVQNVDFNNKLITKGWPTVWKIQTFTLTLL